MIWLWLIVIAGITGMILANVYKKELGREFVKLESHSWCLAVFGLFLICLSEMWALL